MCCRTFDEIIIRHEECAWQNQRIVIQLFTEGIQSVDTGIEIKVISDELEALDYAMQNAVKGSFIVCCRQQKKPVASVEFLH